MKFIVFLLWKITLCIPPKPGNIHRKKPASVHRLPPAPTSEGGIFLEPSLYPTGSGSFLPVLGGTGGYLRTLVSYWGRCLLTDTSTPDGSQVEASSRPEPLRSPSWGLSFLDDLPLTSTGDVTAVLGRSHGGIHVGQDPAGKQVAHPNQGNLRKAS